MGDAGPGARRASREFDRIADLEAGTGGPARGRRHPAIAVNDRGQTLLVWTEGTSWQRGGGLAWQVYDRGGRPLGDRDSAPGVPAWSFVAAFARADGSFAIVY